MPLTDPDAIAARLRDLAAEIDPVVPGPVPTAVEPPVFPPSRNLADAVEQGNGAAIFLDPLGVYDVPALWAPTKPLVLRAAAIGALRYAVPPVDAVLPTFSTQLTLATSSSLVNIRVIGTGDTRGAILTAGYGTIVYGCHLTGGIAGLKRGVLANAAHVTIEQTRIDQIFHGEESQAIVGWTDTLALCVVGNVLTAAGINILIGGADSASARRMPQQILIRGNTLGKDLAWRGNPLVTVKNLLEVKCCVGGTIADNVLTDSWPQNQDGYALLLNVRNQDGRAPWSTIRDLRVQGNQIDRVANGVQILGRDDTHPSDTMDAVVLDQNTFTAVGAYGGGGRQVFISGGPRRLTLQGNQFSPEVGQLLNSFLYFDGQPCEALTVTDNVAEEGEYGIKGEGNVSLGRQAWQVYAPDGVAARNRLRKRQSTRTVDYPDGFVPEAAVVAAGR